MRRCRRRRRTERRAAQAEQGREAERTRADALRDKIEELQVRLAEVETEGDGLTLEAGELRRQVEAAQIAQAATARRSRGFLQGLRDALRGK